MQLFFSKFEELGNPSKHFCKFSNFLEYLSCSTPVSECFWILTDQKKVYQRVSWLYQRISWLYVKVNFVECIFFYNLLKGKGYNMSNAGNGKMMNVNKLSFCEIFSMENHFLSLTFHIYPDLLENWTFRILLSVAPLMTGLSLILEFETLRVITFIEEQHWHSLEFQKTNKYRAKNLLGDQLLVMLRAGLIIHWIQI